MTNIFDKILKAKPATKKATKHVAKPKATRKPRAKRVNVGDEHAARELELAMDSDAYMYNRKKAVVRAVARKMATGKYDEAKAPKLWAYHVKEGAERYVKEYGGNTSTFTKATRDLVAADLAKDEAVKIRRGEYGTDLRVLGGLKGKAAPSRAPRVQKESGSELWAAGLTKYRDAVDLELRHREHTPMSDASSFIDTCFRRKITPQRCAAQIEAHDEKKAFPWQTSGYDH